MTADEQMMKRFAKSFYGPKKEEI